MLMAYDSTGPRYIWEIYLREKEAMWNLQKPLIGKLKCRPIKFSSKAMIPAAKDFTPFTKQPLANEGSQ